MTPVEPDNFRNTAQRFPGTPNQIGDGNWNPYESGWTDTEPVFVQTKTVSALAILSLISGIISIPLMCLCFLSIPLSLFAIVAGHISRGICRRSQGRVTGSGMAVAGLSLGYFSLTMLAGMMVLFFAVGSNEPRGVPEPPPIVVPQWTNESTGDESLDTAIELLSSKSHAGNSDAAVELATHLQASLHDIAQRIQAGISSPANQGAEPNLIAEEELSPESTSIIAELPETNENSELQRALQESTVYCFLKSESCAFLVEISNLSNLNDADRSTLSQMVWLAAGRSLDDNLQPRQGVAVGLVLSTELQEISLGTFEHSDQYDAGLAQRGPPNNDNRMLFESFFQPEQLSSDIKPASEGANDFMLEVPGE